MPENKNSLGCVSSGHPKTTEAAVEILKAGGNAFDAIIAAAFCISITEPMLASLAGGGFLLAQTPTKKPLLYDFFVNFPGSGKSDLHLNMEPLDIHFGNAVQTFHIGTSSIATPGVLKGLIDTHEKLGRIPFKEVIAPGIEMARHGVAINHTQDYVNRVLGPIMQKSKKGEELFFQDGELLKEGDLYKNTDYANFLETLPRDKAQNLYHGDLAKQTLEMLGEETLLTLKDLETFKVIERIPTEMSYRDYTLYTNPLPSLGGQLIFELLGVMKKFDLSNIPFGSPTHVQELSQAMLEVEQSKSSPFTKGTTHISISDSFGNYASMSLSNGEGCGHFIPNTGIMLNNMMGEDDLFDAEKNKFTPGERMPSMMAPTFVERDKDHVFLLGSGGSKRIRSSLMQVISNLVDFKMTLKDAVLSPRINWDGELLQIEKGLSYEALTAIKDSLPINEWPHIAFYFGGTHCVHPNTEAQGDPRRGGSATVL